MEYELINPSDPYTFEAPDLEVAALVVGLLSPTFGAVSKNRKEEEEVPVFIFGGYEEWYKETFSKSPDEGLMARKTEVGQALLSVMLGKFEDREKYNAALEAIDDPAKREAFMEKWQDKRTSLNNIGGVAHAIGKALLKESEATS